MKLRCCVFLLLALAPVATFGQTRAEGGFKRYIGKSSCMSELSGNVGVYGMRLDKTQTAYLEARTLNKVPVLMIIQYAREGDRCGTIKDVVRSRARRNYFEFDCEDHQQPSAVVVGTWPSASNDAQGPAVEAWKIDLPVLKFIPLGNRRVTCIRGSGEGGEDEGDDLADWAKKRASTKTTPATRKRN